ncbi:MAG: hypothetical protein IPK00_19730 [Deltaproteobacteria bacterium]|nr:hypothetical protein [Deltaproteobacteria bacterium]
MSRRAIPVGAGAKHASDAKHESSEKLEKRAFRMNARVMVRCSGNGFGRRVAGVLALLVAGAGLVAMAGCATPGPATDGETTAASRSRCAPGSVLDDRHSLCNGQSGRWW